MKTIYIVLFISLCNLSYSQNTSKRGTIKIEKHIPDSLCTANILGYTGESVIKKAELVAELIEASKIEVNEGCDCKIVSYSLSFRTEISNYGYHATGDSLYLNKVSNKILARKEELLTLKVENIVAKNKTTGAEINLSPIRFKIIN